ncbi:MAG: hypothetical protein MI806_34195 [Minwuiales bacterium]|nr:hypothetical protein [Minwuiales bacterium]
MIDARLQSLLFDLLREEVAKVEDMPRDRYHCLMLLLFRLARTDALTVEQLDQLGEDLDAGFRRIIDRYGLSPGDPLWQGIVN